MSRTALLKKIQPKQLHKIGLYIRVSTEEQASNPEGSIKSQEQRLRSFIDMRNLQEPFGEATAVFIDRARSGKDTNRPELQRLLNAIRSQEITMVMVSELSRLSRSIKDFCEIWNLMQDNNCQFQSLREQFDTTTAAGEMVLYTMANLAQFERKQTSERISANFKARAERGLCNGGSAPFGYHIDQEKKGHLLIHEEDSQIVKEAFTAFLREGTLSKAAKYLNSKGFRITKRRQGGGKPRLGFFTVGNIHKILTNKAYIGIRVFRTTQGIKESKGVWTPIIDTNTFDRVNEILVTSSKNRRWGYLEQRYPYLLSGLVCCGECGDRLPGKSANGNGGKIPYYDHSWAMRKQSCLPKKSLTCMPKRVLANRIEKEVWKQIEAIISNENLALDLISEAHKIHHTKNSVVEVEKLKQKIHTISEQNDALAEHLAQIPKGLSPSSIFNKMRDLQELKAKLEDQLQHLLSSDQTMALPAAFSDYTSFIQKIREMLRKTEANDLRAKVIQRLVHKIEVFPEGFKIHYFVGKNYIRPAMLGIQSSKSLENKDDHLSVNGSKMLLTGGGGGNRTPVRK